MANVESPDGERCRKPESRAGTRWSVCPATVRLSDHLAFHLSGREDVMPRYEYKVLDTGKRLEEELNELGAEGWQVVGLTTKKQLFIAPPQAIILMREVQVAPLVRRRPRVDDPVGVRAPL